MIANAFYSVLLNRQVSAKAVYQDVLMLGNYTMLLSAAVILLAIFVGYICDQYFSMPIQIVGHVALILFATLLKIGYVMRLIGRKGLGARVL